MEKATDASMLSEQQEAAIEGEATQEQQQQKQHELLAAKKFACKLCRCVLFTSDDLMPHEPEQHQISARRKLKDLKHQSAGAAHIDACSSYFLEEVLPWMDDDLLAEGKIHCPTPKCQSRLGALQWSGSQCSCGTWVTPSIKITKSRIDPLQERPSVPIITGVMLPSHAVLPPTPPTKANE